MAAFKRQASLDGTRVSDTADGVLLRGRIKAWGERRMAELAAWSAPGLIDVEDYLAVDISRRPSFYPYHCAYRPGRAAHKFGEDTKETAHEKYPVART